MFIFGSIVATIADSFHHRGFGGRKNIFFEEKKGQKKGKGHGPFPVECL
jgi:hypothetical protein